jgi:hypothetical protein
MIRSVDQDHSTRFEPVFRAVRFSSEGSRLRPDIPTTRATRTSGLFRRNDSLLFRRDFQ